FHSKSKPFIEKQVVKLISELDPDDDTKCIKAFKKISAKLKKFPPLYEKFHLYYHWDKRCILR
ncbi:MAG: hypothetical protein MHPSP_000685, partial [Paramarteilia canceri]